MSICEYSVTQQTRRESMEKVNRTRLYDLILNALNKAPSGLTAREIAQILYKEGAVLHQDRQAVQPRLTELVEKEIIKVSGKRFDNITSRNVAVYTISKSEKES